DVAKGVGLDHRLGSHFLRAGVGFGGSCFPKDVTALKQLAGNSGYQFMLLHAVWEVNELQKRRVVQKQEKHLGPLRGKTIALLGLAFKPNTDDMREAPSIPLVKALVERGAAVSAYDPVARQQAELVLSGVDFADDAYAAADGADALVIVTEWDEFRALDLDRIAALLRGKVLVDLRNVYDRDEAEEAGLSYYGVGRGRVDFS
ncbi:MAG: UDPglucose 6-dehydrogenase, partial [Sphingomonadales bacterium]|nr:UDPglucose 6-dehydrogenase [Sphingomonadales bacterium]